MSRPLRKAPGAEAAMLALALDRGAKKPLQAQLAEAVTAQLKQAFPELSNPLWHKVIAEKRATYACTPDLTRPPPQTALPHFYLAGDYCYADYPATIEGAVRSGLICADLIQASHKVG